ncbi:hypothetical protein HJFPF1_02369 [Paramyrothecium foliicola]|nr:hypothetical protein HJFPF1_02369 [Paramyrothecium foliicola]
MPSGRKRATNPFSHHVDKDVNDVLRMQDEMVKALDDLWDGTECTAKRLGYDDQAFEKLHELDRVRTELDEKIAAQDAVLSELVAAAEVAQKHRATKEDGSEDRNMAKASELIQRELPELSEWLTSDCPRTAGQVVAALTKRFPPLQSSTNPIGLSQRLRTPENNSQIVYDTPDSVRNTRLAQERSQRRERDHERLEDRLRETKAKLAEKTSDNETKSIQLALAQTRIDELEAQLQEQRTAGDTLNERLEKAESSAKDHTLMQELISEIRESRESAPRRDDPELQTLRVEAANLRQHNREIDQALTKEREDHQKTQSERDQMNRAKNKMQVKVSLLDNQVKQERDRIKKAGEELRAAENALIDKSSDARLGQQRIERLEKTIESLEKTLEDLTGQQESLQEQFDSTKSELEEERLKHASALVAVGHKASADQKVVRDNVAHFLASLVDQKSTKFLDILARQVTVPKTDACVLRPATHDAWRVIGASDAVMSGNLIASSMELCSMAQHDPPAEKILPIVCHLQDVLARHSGEMPSWIAKHVAEATAYLVEAYSSHVLKTAAYLVLHALASRCDHETAKERLQFAHATLHRQEPRLEQFLSAICNRRDVTAECPEFCAKLETFVFANIEGSELLIAESHMSHLCFVSKSDVDVHVDNVQFSMNNKEIHIEASGRVIQFLCELLD